MPPPASTNDLEILQPPEQQPPNKTFKPTVHLLDPSFHPAAQAHAAKLFTLITPTSPTFPHWQRDATALLVRTSALPAATIAACPRLRAVSKHGVGTDRIDGAACAARGIAVLNTPGANSAAVAELVLALALAVAREVPRIVRAQERDGGQAVRKEDCRGVTLRGKCVGVVGMGSIGREVARVFHGAFGARVVAYDPLAPEDAWGGVDGVRHERVGSLEEVVRRADVLTLHVPLTDATRGMLAYEQLCWMKREAILINAARGGVVDEEALERVLREGRIWGAGIDCHEVEPPTRERYGRLWELPNVLSTPHIGAATEEAQRAAAMAAVDNLHKHLMALQEKGEVLE